MRSTDSINHSSRTGTRTVCEVVDAGLLAEALAWATSSKTARGEIFNATNGDTFIFHDVWPDLADALRLTMGGAGAAEAVTALP